MPIFYQIVYSDGLLRLDSRNDGLHNADAAFNRAAGFSSPKTTWQTGRRNPLSGGVFTSAFPLSYLFQWETGAGGLAPAGNTLSSLLTRLLFPARPFSSGQAGLKNQREKVNDTMKTIRKGYSRLLISQPIRTFPNLIQAAAFIDRLTACRAEDYRFNIQQSAADKWTVCRVVSGGAA